MSGIQRVVTYLYKYENEEKKQNTGFAKVEVRGTICRIEIHLRNIAGEEGQTMLYLFANRNQDISGIQVGKIQLKRGNVDMMFSFDRQELEPYHLSMNEMEGIYIPFPSGGYLLSQWKEGEFKESNFRIRKANEQEETPIPRQTETPQTEEEVNRESEIKKETKEPTVQATEFVSEARKEAEMQQDSGWETIFQKLRLKNEIIYPFQAENIECVKLNLKDLHYFPRSYWYLGNNSFLLHGYFNYHHLLMGQRVDGDKKEYLIGVPGVFQKQEHIMASMFGFSEFYEKKSEREKNSTSGYWCRII